MRSMLTLSLIAGLACTSQPAQADDKASKKKMTANPKVELTTNLGSMTVELDPAKAPKTVANFLQYVEKGQYDNTIFHRVIRDFMIQGGGFTPDGRKKDTDAPVMNEADNGLRNLPGTIAMARTSDPHSATAQFFINVVNNPFLNHRDKTTRGWGYTVFGRVTAGMDVVEKIRQVKTGARGRFPNAPQEDVIIVKARKL